MATNPRSTPARIRGAIFETAGSIELKVKVSERTGVKAYGFAFAGAPVPMSQGQGKFFTTPSGEKLLEWVMVGDPGGTMKVTVTRDGTKVKEREKSTIPPPGTEGYDAFKIRVS